MCAVPQVTTLHRVRAAGSTRLIALSALSRAGWVSGGMNRHLACPETSALGQKLTSPSAPQSPRSSCALVPSRSLTPSATARSSLSPDVSFFLAGENFWWWEVTRARRRH